MYYSIQQNTIIHLNILIVISNSPPGRGMTGHVELRDDADAALSRIPETPLGFRVDGLGNNIRKLIRTL